MTLNTIVIALFCIVMVLNVVALVRHYLMMRCHDCQPCAASWRATDNSTRRWTSPIRNVLREALILRKARTLYEALARQDLPDALVLFGDVVGQARLAKQFNLLGALHWESDLAMFWIGLANDWTIRRRQCRCAHRSR
jgi:hypothetical protein